MADDGSTTSLTLLGRLRHCPTDQKAWSAFVQRYGSKIYAWGRHWGLQDADAQDVTQSVLLKLAVHMRSFNYPDGGNFRGWLEGVARRGGRQLLPGGRGHVAGLATAKEVEAW